MLRYEYRVVPAPQRVRKLTDLKPGQDRFCATVTDVLTDLGLDGWEFVGSEKLAYRERRLMVFSAEAEKTCLVFRREIEPLAEAPKPIVAEAPRAPEPAPQPEVMGEFRSVARKQKITREAAARVPRRSKGVQTPLSEPGSKERDALMMLARTMKSDVRTNRHA